MLFTHKRTKNNNLMIIYNSITVHFHNTKKYHCQCRTSTCNGVFLTVWHSETSTSSITVSLDCVNSISFDGTLAKITWHVWHNLVMLGVRNNVQEHLLQKVNWTGRVGVKEVRRCQNWQQKRGRELQRRTYEEESLMGKRTGKQAV